VSAAATSGIYESARLLADYLFFHYGEGESFTPEFQIPRHALGFPRRVVRELGGEALGGGRALDLGCAVGGSTFELARTFDEVIGIDFSASFIEAAGILRGEGQLICPIPEEGERTRPFTAKVPAGVDRGRTRFEVGDAMDLRCDIGEFDAVLAANLLCRLPAPGRFLQRLPSLTRPEGLLLLATPFSWLPEFTPREFWLGGKPGDPPSFDILKSILTPSFTLLRTVELPFLIREHARKYQYGISLGSIWRRK